jgi:fumarylacetoacetate (FAA) hydrolase
MKLARLSIGTEEVLASISGDQATLLGAGDQYSLIEIAMAGELPAAGEAIPLAEARVLAPIGRPPALRDFFAFEEHVRNSRGSQGLEVDPGWYEQPIYYFSNPAAIVGPEVAVSPPAGCQALDYELEVACVIGRQATDLDPDDPATMDVVAGFTILNDWSARDLQSKEMRQNLGPTKGKDFATSLGPWLVTQDELPGARQGRPQARMLARVNGVEKSAGNLGDIYFSWPQMLAHASADTQLMPGDVLGSGTCGTGCILEWRMTGHRDTHPWLRAGDVVELDVEGIGVLRNTVASR